MIFRQIHRATRFLLLGLALAMLIVACQTSSVEQSPTTSDSISTERNCRVIEHEMGETEVCGQPQKVVALSPHILDTVLSLGVQPAGLAQYVNANIKTYDNPATQIPYLGKRITTTPMGLGDIGSPSLERLTQLQPDLILGEEVAHEDDYPRLTQIAPTLIFDDFDNPDEVQSWQQDIEGVVH